jgi:hypothetical protein
MSKASEDFLRREHKRIFGDDAIDDETENDAEHQRLQLAVVEAAKTFRAAETAHWVESEVGNDPARTQRERSQAYLRLTETVDALNRFEAEQKNGNT